MVINGISLTRATCTWQLTHARLWQLEQGFVPSTAQKAHQLAPLAPSILKKSLSRLWPAVLCCMLIQLHKARSCPPSAYSLGRASIDLVCIIRGLD